MESTLTLDRQSSFPTKRLILIDWSLFLHRAIFAWSGSDMQAIPATYTCLRMIIGCLKLINFTGDDLVLMALDGRGNWRRDVDPAYKANRKDIKDKSTIDWKYWYAKFDEALEKLKLSTPFNFIRIEKMEADDIIAVAVKHFSDKHCIIISSDSDFEQLYAYPNVQIFSPVSKKYKEVANPFKVLASKIKQEKTDNLISPVITEADFKKRMMLVGLINLPDFVTNVVLDKVKEVCYNRPYDLSLFPFRSLQQPFNDLLKSKPKKEIPIKKKTNIKSPKKKKENKTNVIQSSEKIF